MKPTLIVVYKSIRKKVFKMNLIFHFLKILIYLVYKIIKNLIFKLIFQKSK